MRRFSFFFFTFTSDRIENNNVSVSTRIRKQSERSSCFLKREKRRIKKNVIFFILKVIKRKKKLGKVSIDD